MSGQFSRRRAADQRHAAHRRDAGAVGDIDHHVADRDACRQTQFATGPAAARHSQSVRLDIAFDGAIYWNGEFVASIAALDAAIRRRGCGRQTRRRSASCRRNARATSAWRRCWPQPQRSHVDEHERRAGGRSVGRSATALRNRARRTANASATQQNRPARRPRSHGQHASVARRSQRQPVRGVRLTAMQIDEARARQARGEVVAARADAFEEAAPALALLTSRTARLAYVRRELSGFWFMAAFLAFDLSHISRPAAGHAVMT